ncbi:ATP-grasp domain-containing protein [Egibacter rhizosphaerae]|uniref:ATP-grasp domain-containing protein n=1 Tax=Egibacter rhizosphaerae TaxID=1670831 RepID=A0A411YBT9_9ACTN|nr:ATP-grasp domain-containing protein [Egibacter rhizosphaerae]QBI18670.1 ATP-grasp domain-containing protein [Egibacter rhizosphaerae]
MARVALVLPATTYRAAEFLEAAGRLDIDIVVASDHGSVLDGLGGEHLVRVDLGDSQATAQRLAEVHAHLPLDAVVGVDDAGVRAAAEASAALGLPHAPPDAVAAASDKQELRERLRAGNVDQPRWRVIPSDADLDEAVAAAAEAVGLPCVVKPTRLAASRGVLRADTIRDACDAAERARAIAHAADVPATLLVEGFVPGEEVALDGLVRGGELVPLALFDKPDPLDGPVFEETYYVTPARLDETTAARVTDVAARAVATLGVDEGPVHAELRLPPDRPPVVLEVAARTIGGRCGRALTFGLGMSLEEVVLRHATGKALPALAREDAAAGALMVPIPQATDGANHGVLATFDGIERARAVPGVEEVSRSVPLGRTVRRLPEGDRYLGFVIARARTADEVEAALRRAHAELEIRVEPARDVGADEGSPACAS